MSTTKEANVRPYDYDSREQLRSRLADVLDADDFAKRLKILKGLTPCERICKLRTEQPQRFRLNPIHRTPGPNSQII